MAQGHARGGAGGGAAGEAPQEASFIIGISPSLELAEHYSSAVRNWREQLAVATPLSLGIALSTEGNDKNLYFIISNEGMYIVSVKIDTALFVLSEEDKRYYFDPEKSFVGEINLSKARQSVEHLAHFTGSPHFNQAKPEKRALTVLAFLSSEAIRFCAVENYMREVFSGERSVGVNWEAFYPLLTNWRSHYDKAIGIPEIDNHSLIVKCKAHISRRGGRNDVTAISIQDIRSAKDNKPLTAPIIHGDVTIHADAASQTLTYKKGAAAPIPIALLSPEIKEQILFVQSEFNIEIIRILLHWQGSQLRATLLHEKQLCQQGALICEANPVSEVDVTAFRSMVASSDSGGGAAPSVE